LILLFLLLGIFCTSCALKISKPSNFPTNNLVEEALKFYHQGKLAEATQKLETATQIIPKDSPTWSAAILYSLLGLLQEKTGHSTQASVTFNRVQNLLGDLKGTSPESDVQAKKLVYFGRQLKGQDQISLLQKLALLARISQGKAGEAFFMILISEVHISLNNFQEAYTQATEALNLSKEAGDLNLEMFAILNISGSLVALGKAQEAVNILQIALGKVNDSPKLKANILAQLGLAHGALGFENLTTKEFQEAVNLAISVGDTELVARFHWKYGIAYLFLNKPNEAVRQLTEAIKIFKQLKDKLTVASLEGGVAQSYFRTGAFEDANQHASRAAELFRELGNRTEEARNLRIAGQSLGALNKIDDGLDIIEKAALIQVDEKDREGVLETLWTAVSILKNAGRIEDVKQVLLIWLNTYTSAFKDPEGERKIRWELAKVYDELGRFSKALNEFIKVYYIYNQLSDKKGIILTLIELAQIFAKLNDYESRIEALFWAERLGSEIDDPSIKITILNQTAVLYTELGNIVEALQRYIESIEISKSMNRQVQYIQLGLLGHFYTQIGEYTKAMQYFEEAIRIAKEINDQIGIVSTQTSISYCYLSMNKYDDAIQSAHDSIKILRGIKKDMIQMTQEIEALRVISLALEYRGKYEDALKVQQERLEIAEKSNNLLQISDSYNKIGCIYLELGRYIEAIENFKKAIQMIEVLRFGAEYGKYEIGFLSKQLSPYNRIINAYYQLHHKSNSMKSEFAEEALNFAEKSKSRTLLTQLIAARARSIWEGVPLEIKREEMDLLNESITANEEYENALTRLGISAHEIEEKKNAKDIAYEKWNGFREKIRTRYPKLDKFFFKPVQLNELTPIHLNELTFKGEETLILYKVTSDWVYVWVVIRTGDQNKILKFTQLPSKSSEIEKIVEKLLLSYRRGKYLDFDVNVSNELYEKILRPVIEGVEISKRLIIIPDGMLNVIPFEALVTREGCNNDIKSPCYFGDQFIISYYPSAAILTLARETVAETLPPQGSLLAVGDPIYGPNDNRLDQSQISFLLESARKYEAEFTLKGSRFRKGVEDKGYTFDRLKHSGLEVQGIRDILENSPGDKEVLVGFDASEGCVKSRDLTKYRYLHFALHGILAFDVPYLMEPALVLAIDPEGKEDGFLTLSEINELKLNADLVTLSACKTGLGQRVAGEGVIGLSRAFINAGARAVLVSLWEVADDSTALFMKEFYRLISLGEEKAGALAKAKQRLRQMGYKNPYFWAPFILIGD
jgi:CHAT domain-containing protein/Tfp pilus assembly protein PilF